MSSASTKNQLAAMARTADKLHGMVRTFARSPVSPNEGDLADAMQASLITTSRLSTLAKTAVNSAA